MGLATTLALLGVFSSILGKSYGQIGDALPIGEPPSHNAAPMSSQYARLFYSKSRATYLW